MVEQTGKQYASGKGGRCFTKDTKKTNLDQM